MQTRVTIRQMREGDVETVHDTFAVWHKPREKYQKYFAEQKQGARVVLVALYDERIVGYATIMWNSAYLPFRTQGIPEIVDANVITTFQNQGIGTTLIRVAKQIAMQHSKTTIGISVEQSTAYAAAHRLYSKLGFVPDGRGITLHDNELHLVKVLTN
jgi:GNAT superfamily N-acetyltransferase